MSKLSEAEARFLAADSLLSAGDAAHALCTSKFAQHDFFLAHDLPIPQDFPGGSEPYLSRPDRAEGARGIWITDDYCEAGGAVNANCVVQEYLTGPVLSVQLLGANGRFAALPAVLLTVDDRCDRCAARYPAGLDEEAEAALRALALRVAEAMALEGAAELKAVYHSKTAYLLSLNEGLAPLASTALYFAGLNLADAWVALQEGKTLPGPTQDAAVHIEKDGRAVSARDTDTVGTLTETPDGLTDGIFTLKRA